MMTTRGERKAEVALSERGRRESGRIPTAGERARGLQAGRRRQGRDRPRRRPPSPYPVARNHRTGTTKTQIATPYTAAAAPAELSTLDVARAAADALTRALAYTTRRPLRAATTPPKHESEHGVEAIIARKYQG